MRIRNLLQKPAAHSALPGSAHNPMWRRYIITTNHRLPRPISKWRCRRQVLVLESARPGRLLGGNRSTRTADSITERAGRRPERAAQGDLLNAPVGYGRHSRSVICEHTFYYAG